MQLHLLKPTHAGRKSRRIGRGGKRGTTSGRGTKGQRSRAGAKIRPAIRDVLKKIPKLRGYRFRSFAVKPVVLSISALESAFSNGSEITPALLLSRGLVHKMKGRTPAVKILGGGTLSKKFALKGLSLSRQAEEKIRAAGGTVSS